MPVKITVSLPLWIPNSKKIFFKALIFLQAELSLAPNEAVNYINILIVKKKQFNGLYD